MGISYQICQHMECVKSPIARGHCQAKLRTIREVPKKQDASGGAVGKAILSHSRQDPPVFILHDMVSMPTQMDLDEDTSVMGIDVSYKASHYRILLRTDKKGAWHAYKIVGLPPMQYFDAVSRQVVTEMNRTQLLANTVADQVSSRNDDYANIPDGGGEGEPIYANRPDNYANI